MANNRAKRYPMTTEEMAVQVEQQKTSKIYKAESQQISEAAISRSIRNAIAEIESNEGRQKVSLDDSETVKALVKGYLDLCATKSVFPSMSGVSGALGYTTRAITIYMNKNPGTETGQFLHKVHDKLADVLAENSLKGNSNNIVSIFLLKALYGLRDTQTLEIVPGSPIEESPSINELALRAGLLDD